MWDFVFPPDVEVPKSDFRRCAVPQRQNRGQIYQEDHKLFVYPSFPGKLAGIRALDWSLLLRWEMNSVIWNAVRQRLSGNSGRL